MKIQLTMMVNPYDLWSSICGSAWESWEWWLGWKYEGGDWENPCTLWVVAENPYDDGAITATVTVDDLARAIEDLQHSTVVMAAVVSSDFDALTGDIIMQQAIFGEVVYG